MSVVLKQGRDRCLLLGALWRVLLEPSVSVSRHAPGHNIPSSVGLRSFGDNQIPSAPTRF
eukprot:6100079-Pyramimonas_sp.AAC.1